MIKTFDDYMLLLESASIKTGPFYIENLEDVELTAYITNRNHNSIGKLPNLYYSFDGKTYLSAKDHIKKGSGSISKGYASDEFEIDVPGHSKLYLASEGPICLTHQNTSIPITTKYTISPDFEFAAGGDISWMGNFNPKKNHANPWLDLSEHENCFAELLASSNLRDISNLTLPATKLSIGCYKGLFSFASLEDVSMLELNASELATKCYQGMFENCVALTKLPSFNKEGISEHFASRMGIKPGPQKNINPITLKNMINQLPQSVWGWMFEDTPFDKKNKIPYRSGTYRD